MSGSLGAVGRIALTAAGYYFGGPAGAFVGQVAGSFLFPQELPDIEGPRINDAPVTNSAEGLPLPEFFGTNVTPGNVLWDGGMREIRVTEDVGGKGPPSQSVSSSIALRSYALGLGKQIGAVRRIWRNEVIIYDRRPQQDGESGADYAERLAISDELDERMTVYLGTADQLPDPTIEAALGVGNTPAYRRRSYLVFTDDDVTDNGGRIPTYRVEVTYQIPTETTTTEYSTDVLYPWVPGTADPRECKNDHEYRFEQNDGTIIIGAWRATLAEALADAEAEVGRPVINQIIGWSTESEFLLMQTVSPFEVVDPGEKEILYLHFNEFTDLVEEDRFFGSLIKNTNICNSWAGNGIAPGDDYFYWTGKWDDGSLAGTQVAGVYSFSSATDGGGFAVYDPPLVEDAEYTNNCTNYPNPEGYFPAVHGARDVLIGVRRKIRAPDEPCLPRCEDPYPDSPISDQYCEIDGTAALRGPWVATVGTFKVLAMYTVDGVSPAEVSVYPLNPTLPEDHPSYDDEAYWIAARNAAILAGYDVPSTYSETGEDGPTTYPRLVDSAYVRTAGTLIVADGDGESLGAIVRRCSELAGLTSEQVDVSDLTEIVYGYQLNSVVNARGAISSLRPFGYFDGVESGGQLKFPRRGKASVAELTVDDLGAHAAGTPEPEQIVQPVYVDDVELPRAVRVTYIDKDSEYQRGQQTRGRVTVASKNALDVEVPVVMSADKAAQIRDVLLAERWIGRETYTTEARPQFMALEAGDAVVIPLRGETQRALITSVRFRPGGRKELTLRRDDASPYYPTATGVPSGIGERPLQALGDTTLVVIDGPALVEEHDEAGVYLAARGEGERWRGCGVFQSTDGGENYSRITTIDGASTMGHITSALPEGPYHLWDRANVIEVTLDTGTLESRTEEAVAGGANPAWVGHPDRGWELVLFADAVLTGTDEQGRSVYNVSTFLRGRQGTEWVIGSSMANDYFILARTCVRLPLNSSQIGVPRIFKAVSFGKLVESGPEQNVTPAGVALECYAPTLVKGQRDGSGNLDIYAVRRARPSGEWNDSDFVPLNEESEAYEIDVLDLGSPGGVVRTLSGSSFPIPYSAADQTADFGSPQASIAVVVYQLSATVGRGYPTEAIL